MRFEGGSRAGFVICAVVLFCGIFAGTANSADLIYDNSTVNGYFAPGSGVETLDYGRSIGGNVTEFTVGYYPTSSSVGSITIRFYRDTTFSYYPGSHIKTITVNNLTSGYYTHYATRTLSASEQFQLPSGAFGYSYEFSNHNTCPVLAYGGFGNEDFLFDNSWGIFLPFGFSNAWAGLYMEVYTGPPPEPTRVSGYKFDDADGNGVWDGGEDVLEGWRIYIDENGNGQFDSTEPNDITDPNGYYEFLNLPTPDTITVAEVMQEGWTQTLPGGEGTYEVSIVSEGQYTNRNFGNTDEPVVTDVTISGYVLLSDGSGLDLVQINPFGLVTDPDGYYSKTVESGWSGSISAVRPGWHLSDSVSYFDITTDQTHDFTAYWPYSGGIGSEASPYQISTVQDLFDLGDNTHDYDKHFVLTNDIDLIDAPATTYVNALIPAFGGQFDGAGFSVLNLHGMSGLFGYIKEAVIKNLGVENVDITYGNSVGAICKSNYGGTIENCFSTGNISGYFDVGGICAWVHTENMDDAPPFGAPPSENTPVIKNCYSTVNVTLIRSTNN